jgi:hypothetical protein
MVDLRFGVCCRTTFVDPSKLTLIDADPAYSRSKSGVELRGGVLLRKQGQTIADRRPKLSLALVAGMINQSKIRSD